MLADCFWLLFGLFFFSFFLGSVMMDDVGYGWKTRVRFGAVGWELGGYTSGSFLATVWVSLLGCIMLFGFMLGKALVLDTGIGLGRIHRWLVLLVLFVFVLGSIMME